MHLQKLEDVDPIIVSLSIEPVINHRFKANIQYAYILYSHAIRRSNQYRWLIVCSTPTLLVQDLSRPSHHCYYCD